MTSTENDFILLKKMLLLKKSIKSEDGEEVTQEEKPLKLISVEEIGDASNNE